MKIILESWRKFVKEEKVDPKMAKYLRDNPYHEADGLQEKRWEDFERPKGEWSELSADEIELSKDPANVDVAEELFMLINNAYKAIGGNFDYKTPGDLPGNANYWNVLDIDDDPEPDVLRVGKRKPYGLKLTASGHDGSREAIEAYKSKTADLLSRPGVYAEMSKGIAHVMLKYFGAPYVDSEEVVQTVLGPSKPVEWLGAHPDGKYPGINGWYRREIQGNPGELKIMLGTPNV